MIVGPAGHCRRQQQQPNPAANKRRKSGGRIGPNGSRAAHLIARDLFRPANRFGSRIPIYCAVFSVSTSWQPPAGSGSGDILFDFAPELEEKGPVFHLIDASIPLFRAASSWPLPDSSLSSQWSSIRVYSAAIRSNKQRQNKSTGRPAASLGGNKSCIKESHPQRGSMPVDDGKANVTVRTRNERLKVIVDPSALCLAEGKSGNVVILPLKIGLAFLWH